MHHGWIRLTLCLLLLLTVQARAEDKPAPPAATRYPEGARATPGETAARMDTLSKQAEVGAERHVNGGAIGILAWDRPLHAELMGRAGGFVHFGFERVWTRRRTDEQRANDIVIIELTGRFRGRDRWRLREHRDQGHYIIGFGSADDPAYEDVRDLCDVVIDHGLGEQHHRIELADGTHAGDAAHLVNTANAWVFTGELVAALTRRGHMPTMWMAYLYPEGHAWGDRYLGKQQFHDEFDIAPIPAGKLGRAYLGHMRDLLTRFRDTQADAVQQAAKLISDEVRTDRKVFVAVAGHAMPFIVGYGRDGRWARGTEVYAHLPEFLARLDDVPRDVLVLRLGYYGLHEDVAAKLKGRRVILLTNPHTDPVFQHDGGAMVKIDMACPFGDAVVEIENYPIRILPPSGIMQIAAYEAINTQVLDNLAADTPAERQDLPALAD